MTYTGFFNSPIGCMEVQTNHDALLALRFTNEKHKIEIPPHSPPIILQTIEQLQQYFEKKLHEFSLPISLELTEFRKRTLEEVKKVPFGHIITYTQLANRMGSSLMTRAVATANASNPILIIIPCHRIVGKNGSMTGYSGETWRKEWLLKHEQAIPQLNL